MNHDILVSIGMPVYNSEKFLKQSILSILNQTYTNFELLISDDGSTDNSLNIIHSFSDARIKLIKGDSNRGIGYRLNELIKLSKGKYFARMDGDDLMFPTRLEKQVTHLEENQNLDVIGSSAVIIDENNSISGIRKCKSDININDAYGKSLFIHPSIMGKTSWFRKHLYNGHFNGTEDHELFLRSYYSSQFSCIENPLIFYRENNRNNKSKFLKRQKEIVLGINENESVFNSRTLFFKLKTTIYFKSIFYQITPSTIISYFITKKRNAVPNENEQRVYSSILNSQLA